MTERPPNKLILGIPPIFFWLIEIVAWVVLVGVAIIYWLTFAERGPGEKATVIILLALFNAWVFHWCFPRFGSYRWLYLPMVIVQIAMVGFGTFVLYPYNVSNFFIVLIGITAVLAQWQMVWLAVLLSTIVDIVIRLARNQTPTDLIISVGFDFFMMLVTAYLLGFLAQVIRGQFASTTRRNRELSLLLDLTTPTGAFLNSHAILPTMAKKIAIGLPATLCRIYLLAEDGKSLVIYGVYPLRSVPANLALGERYPIDNLPWHRQAIETRKPIVIRADQILKEFGELERQAWLFEGVQSACWVPFGADDVMTGLITLAEARSWEREPFDERKLQLLQTLAGQLAIVVQNAQLHEDMRKQAERFLVLNEVAHAIGSTIEMEDLLELIYQQLSEIISTDTYYVALYNAQEETIDLRILIDDGKRYDPEKIPVGSGLVGLVIRNRRAMLFNHLSVERSSLPISPVTVGASRPSESWLGVPLMSGDNLMGLLVVASYTAFSFNEEDQRMMANLAEQVVLALDNARHHADVEQQSRCDSLTGAFNHGYLIELLRGEVENSRAKNYRVSLIMMDIDFFKQYNDTFGHTVGDAVLRATVQAIQSHIKQTDSVGRWGGEEFAVILHDASTEQARQVAERIRQTMACLTLRGTLDLPVPAPTVSQGIATFPDHAISADALVVEADRTLYRAKSSGRDQVAIAREHVQ